MANAGRRVIQSQRVRNTIAPLVNAAGKDSEIMVPCDVPKNLLRSYVLGRYRERANLKPLDLLHIIGICMYLRMHFCCM
jgi:hypothetical protein